MRAILVFYSDIDEPEGKEYNCLPKFCPAPEPVWMEVRQQKAFSSKLRPSWLNIGYWFWMVHRNAHNIFMLAISDLLSLWHFVISLASISASSTAYAAPSPVGLHDAWPSAEVHIGGKVGSLGKQLSPKSHDNSTVHRLGKLSLKSSVKIIAEVLNTDHCGQ